MLGRLTRKDYETILRHYNVPFKSSDKLKKVRANAEEILRNKLCRCIKKVKTSKRRDSEKAAIPICKKSIFIGTTLLTVVSAAKARPSVCAVEVDRGAAQRHRLR